MGYNAQTDYFEEGKVNESLGFIKEVPMEFYKGEAKIWGDDGKYQATYVGQNIFVAGPECDSEDVALASLEHLISNLNGMELMLPSPKISTIEN